MTSPQPESTTDLRLVVVMRHGEAKGSSSNGDEGRPLTSRGRDQAVAAGRWLVEQGVRPDVVVLSPAVRTRQTWEGLQAGGLSANEVREDRAVYNGAADDIVEAVSILPESVHVVLVVGHAPAIPDVATGAAVHCETPRGWAPATLGVLSHPGSWDEFPGGDTALVAWHAPSDH